MNWFIICNGLLYAGAMVVAIEKAQYSWALVWFCYGLSCFALATIESRS